jgi:hypothetical protein
MTKATSSKRGATMAMVLKTGEFVTDKRRDTAGVPQEILEEVLRCVSGTRKFIKTAVNVRREVGTTNCVGVGPTDRFVEANRPGKDWKTRFVVGRMRERTSWVTVLLAPAGSAYNLIASYCGEVAPPEPDDTAALARESNPAAAPALARQFWESHALVLGADDVMCTACGTVQIRKERVVRCHDAASNQILCGNCWWNQCLPTGPLGEFLPPGEWPRTEPDPTADPAPDEPEPDVQETDPRVNQDRLPVYRRLGCNRVVEAGTWFRQRNYVAYLFSLPNGTIVAVLDTAAYGNAAYVFLVARRDELVTRAWAIDAQRTKGELVHEGVGPTFQQRLTHHGDWEGRLEMLLEELDGGATA